MNQDPKGMRFLPVSCPLLSHCTQMSRQLSKCYFKQNPPCPGPAAGCRRSSDMQATRPACPAWQSREGCVQNEECEV